MKTKKALNYIKYSDIAPLYSVLYNNEIWKFLFPLVFEYPGFKSWYNNLFNVDFTLKSNREIIMCCYNENVIGVAILKNSVTEKKICTLRVDSKYKNNGIGKNLIKESLSILETDKPMITLHKSKEKEFERLFRFFDFQLEQSVRGYYKLFGSENVYNGYLPPKEKILTSRTLDDVKELFEDAVASGVASYNYFLQLCIERFVEKDDYELYKRKSV